MQQQTTHAMTSIVDGDNVKATASIHIINESSLESLHIVTVMIHRKIDNAIVTLSECHDNSIAAWDFFNAELRLIHSMNELKPDVFYGLTKHGRNWRQAEYQGGENVVLGN